MTLIRTTTYTPSTAKLATIQGTTIDQRWIRDHFDVHNTLDSAVTALKEAHKHILLSDVYITVANAAYTLFSVPVYAGTWHVSVQALWVNTTTSHSIWMLIASDDEPVNAIMYDTLPIGASSRHIHGLLNISADQNRIVVAVSSGATTTKVACNQSTTGVDTQMILRRIT